MLKTLESLAILFAGVMVGAEFTIAVFINPAFEKLSEADHRAVVSPLAKLLGRVMPFWYASVLLLTASVALVLWLQSRQLRMPVNASTALWAMAIVVSILWLVPLNNRISSWTGTSFPADWRETRRRWDILHRFRVALLLLALISLIVGTLSAHEAI